MDTERIIEKIRSAFEDALTQTRTDIPQPYVFLKADRAHDVIRFLRDDTDTSFKFLRCLSGIDENDSFTLVYHLYSYEKAHAITLKVSLSKTDPVMRSISDIYKVADWYERETFDMLGIKFEGHPDLRRILLPDDWEGHPLRKDYQEIKEYRGIPHSRDKR